MQNEVIEYLKKHREKHLSELKNFLPSRVLVLCHLIMKMSKKQQNG